MLIHLQWNTSQINTENRMLVPVKTSVDLCWWQHWTISTELDIKGFSTKRRGKRITAERLFGANGAFVLMKG